MARQPRFKTLQHQLAFWPVLCSVVIMVVGGLVMWYYARARITQYRQKEFTNFAEVLKTDLEFELHRVVDDVSNWATRWRLLALDETRQDSEVDERIRRFSQWAIELRPDQRARYDLVLFVDRTGTVQFATSALLSDPLTRNTVTDRRVSDLLQLPADWLNEVIEKNVAKSASVRRIDSLNALLQRHLPPSGSYELPSYYHFVIAAPVVIPTRLGAPRTVGAVIAVASWAPFQRILDIIEDKCEALGFKNGYPYLIDSDSETVIGHKYRDPNNSADNFYATRLSLLGLEALAVRFRENPIGVYYYNFRGQRKFALLERITPPDPDLSPTLDWRLGVGVDEVEVLAPVTQLTYSFVSIVGVAAFAVFITTYFIAHRVSVTVHQLTQMTNAAAAGQATFISRPQSHDEISELQSAIGHLAIHLRHEIGYEVIPNPYVAGIPIQKAEMFFGRHEDLAWVSDHLRQPGNDLILLVGQRRIGKTSLLHHISRNRVELNILPFFLDTQVFLHSITSDALFYRTLLEEMLQQLPEIAPQLQRPVLGDLGSSETFTRFIKFLNNHVSAVPVCLFDELDNFEIKFKDRTVSTEVITFLAGLLESKRTLSIIATGSDHNHLRKAKHWNALLLKKCTPTPRRAFANRWPPDDSRSASWEDRI